MKKQRKKIGIVISEARHHFFSKMMEYLQRELLEMDMDVITYVTLCKGEMQEEYAKAECAVYDAMNLEMLDGIILCPNTFVLPQQDEILHRIREKYTGPVVCIEKGVYDYPVVLFNEEDGIGLLVEHLHREHGAKRIEYVSGKKDTENAYYKNMERYYRAAMARQGLEVGEHSVHYGDGWVHAGATMAQEISSQEEGLPDAVICVSNEAAGALIAGFADLGIQVPRDVLVCGYNEDVEDELHTSLFTSIHRNPEKMAVNTARKLRNLMEGKQLYSYVREDGNCELDLGNTCGCSGYSLGSYAKRRVSEVLTEYEQFPSTYNFMAEDITGFQNFEDCLWNVEYYTWYLGNFESFYLCLNENAMHMKEEQQHFTDKMLLALSREGDAKQVSEEYMFPRKQLIPALSEPCDYPRVFYVASLHFMGRVFGYSVLSYGSKPEAYNRYFGAWMRKLALALETQRRWLIYKDVTEENQIRDLMTGLYNYKGFLNALRERYLHMTGTVNLRVIVLDISRFSSINDAYGRDEGNEALLTLTKIIQNTISDCDVCARLGNDEFAIAGLYEEEKDPTGMIAELTARLQHYNQFGKKPYSIDISYAKLSEMVQNEESLVTIISDAMAQKRMAKQNRYKAVTTEEVVNEEERGNVIRMLDDNLFTYVFQPIIDAKTGAVYSYEALMRSGDGLRISPLNILKHAAAIGRSYDVERHTFFNVLKMMRQNEELLKGKKLFINSIPKDTLTEKDFDKLVSQYRDLFKSVVVEFTEQTEADKKQIEQIKERSRNVGFQLAIDDYGSGYSNITNLLTYMPDYVKLDRSLVSGVNEDSKKQYFVSNIIEFAHENGFYALAEGVETKEEMQILIQLGVDLLQGYYTARPQEGFLQEIPKELRDEILSMNLRNMDVRQRKTYQVGDEHEIMLMPLVLDGYTEISITKPEVILCGNPKFVADIIIHIPDNTDCTIHLRRLCMEAFQGRPCVEIGNNCNVTLVIEGVVQMDYRGIRVPESSSLVLEGEGKLFINCSTEYAYGIGGGSTHTFGKITVRMDGEIKLQLDGKDCVGIGGGYAVHGQGISIERCKNLYMVLSGEQGLGVGAYYSDVDISIEHTRLKPEMHSNTGTTVGSFTGKSVISMKNVTYNGLSTGDYQMMIGTLREAEAKISIERCDFQMEARAKKCIGIGSSDAKADVRIVASSMLIRFEGTRVIGIGSESRRGRGHFEGTSFLIRLASGDGAQFGYEPEAMSFLRCSMLE